MKYLVNKKKAILEYSTAFMFYKKRKRLVFTVDCKLSH